MGHNLASSRSSRRNWSQSSRRNVRSFPFCSRRPPPPPPTATAGQEEQAPPTPPLGNSHPLPPPQSLVSLQAGWKLEEKRDFLCQTYTYEGRGETKGIFQERGKGGRGEEGSSVGRREEEKRRQKGGGRKMERKKNRFGACLRHLAANLREQLHLACASGDAQMDLT